MESFHGLSFPPLCLSLSVAVQQKGAKCHSSGSERKGRVGLQASGRGVFTLLSLTLLCFLKLLSRIIISSNMFVTQRVNLNAFICSCESL